MNCWCPNLCSLSSFMCRDLKNLGMQRESGEQLLENHTQIQAKQCTIQGPSQFLSVKLHLLPIPTIFSQTHELIINPGAESSSQAHFLWCYKNHFSIHKNFSGHSVRLVLVLKSFPANCSERAWPSPHILHWTWKDEREAMEYKNEHPASIQKCQPKPLDNYKFYIIHRTTLNLMTLMLKTASVIIFIGIF